MQKFRSWFKLYFRETDKLLFFLCLCASVFGMLLVYSATKNGATKLIPSELPVSYTHLTLPTKA